jgi:hypothetical protein
MSLLVAIALLAAATSPVVDPMASPGGLEPLDHYSGTLVSIDRGRDVMLVDEVGRWDPVTERASVTRRTIHFTALTNFKVFVRTTVPGAYTGDFVEFTVGVDALMPGDVVTAECVRNGSALVALELIVADVP